MISGKRWQVSPDLYSIPYSIELRYTYVYAYLHHHRDWHVIGRVRLYQYTKVGTYYSHTLPYTQVTQPVNPQAIQMNLLYNNALTNTKHKTREWLPAAQRLFNSVFLGSALQLLAPAVRRPHGPGKLPARVTSEGPLNSP
ncbi:hypothetical protein V8C26DRAFT_64862 [Trichoderma gracile]